MTTMKEYINNLSVGTKLTKEEFDELRTANAKARRTLKKEGLSYEHLEYISWEELRVNPQKYGLKKCEAFREAKCYKYSAIDVLEMIKSGKTVEEIEPLLYTKVRYIYFEKI